MHLFLQSQKLFANNLNIGTIPHSTFLQTKSQFKDQWYNFLTPTAEVEEFDWEKPTQVIHTEYHAGFSLSIYVEEKKYQAYAPALQVKGYGEVGNDIYVQISMKKRYEVESREIEDISHDDLQAYKDLAQTCFPNWANSREFTQLCFDLAQRDEEDMLYRNCAIWKDNQMVCIGSVLASKTLGLGYLHNVGTHPDYRRQGLFTKLSKHLCNLAFDFGAGKVFAIVEDGGLSFQGYGKMSFAPIEKYSIWRRE